MKKNVFRRLAVLLYCSLIFFLSSQKIPENLTVIEGADKVVHFFEYGFLAFLLYRMSIEETGKWLREHPFLSSWIFTVFYGIIDEFHQSFVPTRNMSIGDLLADGLGAAVVLWVIAFRKSKRIGVEKRRGTDIKDGGIL